MKVKAKIGFVYDGVVRKRGEEFDAVGYAFNWLTENGWAEPLCKEVKPPEDDLVVTNEGLPPLEEPIKKGKKNG